jgi:hypothetical protein
VGDHGYYDENWDIYTWEPGQQIQAGHIREDKMDRREIIKARMAELEQELVELRMFGEDVYKEGDVLIFDLDFGNPQKTWRYAAIKGGSLWHVTGRNTLKYATWDQLVTFWRNSHAVKIWAVSRKRKVFEA